MKIIQVAAGYYHSMALDDSNEIWTWGTGQRGQLGNGPEVIYIPKPKKLVIKNEKFKFIAAGELNSLGITVSGDIWMWGSNVCGQLCNGKTDKNSKFVSVPTPITNPSKITFLTAALGINHVYALSDNYVLYFWGRSITNPEVVCTSPTEIACPAEGSVFVEVATSPHHALALTDKGMVYAWGASAYLQTGQDTINTLSEPKLVPWITQVIALSCGTFFSVVLSLSASEEDAPTEQEFQEARSIITCKDKLRSSPHKLATQQKRKSMKSLGKRNSLKAPGNTNRLSSQPPVHKLPDSHKKKRLSGVQQGMPPLSIPPPQDHPASAKLDSPKTPKSSKIDSHKLSASHNPERDTSHREYKEAEPLISYEDPANAVETAEVKRKRVGSDGEKKVGMMKGLTRGFSEKILKDTRITIKQEVKLSDNSSVRSLSARNSFKNLSLEVIEKVSRTNEKPDQKKIFQIQQELLELDREEQKLLKEVKRIQQEIHQVQKKQSSLITQLHNS
eukprot:TRINITY_DN10602_c0_g1_i2.p1 TRINITY_DN10602_c0_g1~~TRINITY_DN10602_c0_g1_i2.p1  ORF type:complete len:503 (-),score=164.55 TRINITY_DN10602_c0_g1_i2:89-1597(-)